MVSASLILIGIVVLLLVLNFLVSLFPKRNVQVKVAFIPPSNPTSYSDDLTPSMGLAGQLSAHIHATNTKITQLFSRMEEVETRIVELERSLPSSPTKEEVWVESVSVANKKK